MTNAPGAVPSEDRLAGLASWLDAQTPGTTHEIVAIDRPAAGYSSETALVDVRRTDAGVGSARDERLVVKLPPAGPAIFPTYDFALQARVQEAAAAAGIPTAVPARSEADEHWLGVPFLVMPAVEGHIVGEVPAFDRRLVDADAAR